MARLHNIRFFTLDPAVWRGRTAPVKVGNNRTLDFETLPAGGHMLTFRLHGNVVGRVYQLPERMGEAKAPRVCITLSDAGWPTRTTAQAQQDFLGALGFRSSVSYARGGFRLSAQDRMGGNEDVFVELPERPGTYRFEVLDRYSQRQAA